MSLILMAVVVIHLPLLLLRLPLKSYDTNFHILFASQYVHSWFDPWNPKWYAGFSQTTYPPLPQQWVALISHLTGLDMAYMTVQLAAMLLLAVGVYRFSLLWVSPRAASLAALGTAFLGSESFLVYSAGQLGTTSAAPIYLNALPFLYEWVRLGNKKSLLKAVVMCGAAAAAHHATLLFGAVFFAVPVLALAFFDTRDGERVTTPAFVMRTVTSVVLIGAAMVIVILPFWIALIKYPVTQLPIPHPSRGNYILNPFWGLNYFVIPWGGLALAIPFVLWRGAVVPRLRPLVLGFWLAFMVGLGGTTPVGLMFLRRAFDVLTMERFSYWATLLALPIVGALALELINRFKMRAVIALTILAGITCAAGAGWVTFRAAEGEDFNVDPIAGWLNRDGHDHYRYITLGFGNQLARLATKTNASSVDGEWNSGRMLPELTQHGAGALTSSKGFGTNGLEALRAMLLHADRYGLKWVISRDPYYDALLSFAGWRPVDTLEDGTITVWSKDGVPPATPLNAAQMPPHWQGIWWGLLPFGSSLLAILVLLMPGEDRLGTESDDPLSTDDESLAHGRLVS